MGTGEVTSGNAIAFTVKQGDFKGNTKPTLTVTNMAAAETATIVKSGQIVKNGALAFDNSDCSVTLESPGEYAIYKSATVGDPAVIIENSI